MPAQNPMLRNWQSELQAFDKNFLLLTEDLSPESIHDFRVSIKKLRSYSRLFDNAGVKKIAESLFSILGRHRNLEICKELLVPWKKKHTAMAGKLALYFQLLQDQNSEYCKQVVARCQESDHTKTINQQKEYLEKRSPELTIERVTQSISSSIDHITTHFNEFEDQPHKMRKRMKDIYYWAKMMGDESPLSKLMVKKTDKVLSILGSLQDHEVLRDQLKFYRNTILSDGLEEYDDVRKFEETMKNKTGKLLKKARETAEEWIKENKDGKDKDGQ